MDSNLDPVTRDELYQQVWREPMLKLAERYKVSSSYLARVCVELRVPRPERGYWAKLEYGKASPKPSLPPARPGDLTEWRAGLPLTTTERTAVARKQRATRATLAPTADAIAAPTLTARPQRHELVDDVKQFFLKTRKPDDTGHLRPFKRHLVDIVVSEALLDSALDAADALFRALTKSGHRVVLAPGTSQSRRDLDVREIPRKQGYLRHVWSPDQVTTVFVGDTLIGITIFETTEFVEMVGIGNSKYIAVRDMTPEQLRRFSDPRYWRTTRELPTGRLGLLAFSKAWRAPWTQRWSERKPGQFASFIPEVIKSLRSVAPDIAQRTEEAERKAEDERLEWERKQELERQEAERARKVNARQDSRQDLLAAIASWEQVRSVHAYFEAAEQALAKLPESEQTPLRARLAEARELVGELDALAKLKTWKSPHER
jgi:hypothetical protein